MSNEVKYWCCPDCGMQFTQTPTGRSDTAHSCPGKEGMCVVSPPWLIMTGEFDINGKPIFAGATVEIAPTYEDGSSVGEHAGERFTVRWGWWDGGDNVCKTWILVNTKYPGPTETGDFRGRETLWDGTIWGFPLKVI